MSAATKNQFLDNLRASEIVADDKIILWLEPIAEENNEKRIANFLVKAGHLTRWQAGYLLSGRTKLRFGNYVLLERINRDETGDSFTGKHQQLDRLVNMLFVSSKLSKRITVNPDLIRELGEIADVAHENIEHVYLIDQESERYMLVTERFDGLSLNDPKLLTSLNPKNLPGILKQAISAIAHTHQTGLSHGDLSEKSFYLDDQYKLTVVGFLKSRLTGNTDKSNHQEKRQQDIRAIKQVGKRLASRLSRSEHLGTAKKVSEIIDKLGSPEVSFAEAILALEHLERPASNQAKASTAHDAQPPQKMHGSKLSPSRLEKTAEQPGSSLTGRLLWVSAAILALAALYFPGTRLGTGRSPGTTNTSREVENQNKELPSLANLDKQSDSHDFKLDEPSPVASQFSATTSEKHALESSEQNVSVPTKDKSVDDDQIAENRLDVDTPFDSEPAGLGGIDSGEVEPAGTSILDKFNSLRDESDSATDKENSEKKQTAAVTESDTNSTAELKQSLNKDKPGQIPPFVDLPEIDVITPKQLIKLTTESTTSVNLDLVSDENVSKSKSVFELSTEYDNKWEVRLRSTGNSDNKKIAVLSRTNTQINFNWEESAKEIMNAPYLRNCILKLEIAGSTSNIALRKPIKIPGFILDRNQPRLKIEIPGLDFLPKIPVAELLELDEKTYGQIYFGEERENRSFARNKPLILHFSELPEYQMLFLSLSSDIKNKSYLNAKLEVQLAPGQRPVLATDKSIEEAKKFLEGYIHEVKHNHDTLKATPIDELRRQLKLSKDQFKNAQKLAKVKELKAELELSENRADAFRKIQSQLEAFYNKPTPVDVYFENSGQRVVLATTVFDD